MQQQQQLNPIPNFLNAKSCNGRFLLFLDVTEMWFSFDRSYLGSFVKSSFSLQSGALEIRKLQPNFLFGFFSSWRFS